MVLTPQIIWENCQVPDKHVKCIVQKIIANSADSGGEEEEEEEEEEGEGGATEIPNHKH